MENKTKEKHLNFVRIASARTEKVIQRIEQLERCANRANYEYSAEEVAEIFGAIEETLSHCRKAFESPAKVRRKAFCLSGAPLPGQMSITDDQIEGGEGSEEPEGEL